MRPVLCMITPLVATPDGDAALIERARGAARAGVHLVHIRQPERDARQLMALVEAIVKAVAGTDARVLVNDRVDVAIAARAHGVHLRGDSMPAPCVRRMTPTGFLVGRSVHSAAEAAKVDEHGGLDYLVFGTVFSTPSKPGARVAGVQALRTACLATRLPVLAVGGMTTDRASEVARAGAAGIAAIGLFADAPLDRLQTALEAVGSAFDTPPTLP